MQGLMAQAVMPDNVSVDDLSWHESSSQPGWQWRGEACSRDVVGHMLIYPLVYDLLAEEEEEKREVEEVVADILSESLAGRGWGWDGKFINTNIHH